MALPADAAHAGVPAPGIRHLWLLNGSQQDRLFLRLEGIGVPRLQAQVYDRALEPGAAFALVADGTRAVLDAAVEPGGAVELRA